MTTMIHMDRSPYRKSRILYMMRNKFNFQTGVLDRVPQLTYIHEGNIIIYLKIMVRIGLLVGVVCNLGDPGWWLCLACWGHDIDPYLPCCPPTYQCHCP